MSTAIIKPQWSFVSITMMVLGFVLFWPLGLAMLAYIIWGERFGGSKEKAEAWMHKQRSQWKSSRRDGTSRRGRGFASGNAAFDDYRSEQLKRLDEERKRLDDEVSAFHEHMDNLAKARDREEFDRFMRDRGQNGSQSNDQNHGHSDGENRQGF